MRKWLPPVVTHVAVALAIGISPAMATGAADQKAPPIPARKPALAQSGKVEPESPDKAKPAATGLLSKPEAAPAPEAAAPPNIPPFDVAVLATGIRASRVMGKAVRNEAGEDIGTVNDLIINPPDNGPYAIIGVGGFLGVGERLVAVPFDALQPRDAGNGLILPGATKDSIKLLPEFKYPPRPERPLN